MADKRAGAFGAAAVFAAKRFGGLLREFVSNPTVGIASAELIGANPERVFILVVNLSTVDVFLSWSPGASSTNGVLIGPSGGSMSLDVETDGTLPANRLFAIAGAAASQMFILELRRVTKITAEEIEGET